MEKEGFTPGLRSALFQALTGRTADVTGSREGELRGMLMAIGGPSTRTGSGIDLTAAAKQLGVTRRTVERWVTGATERGRPTGKNLTNLVAKSRQAATTQRGRRAALADTRKSQLPSYGAKLGVTGEQGPTRAGRDYRRLRRIDLALDPAEVEAMLGAYEQGGDKGFVSWFEGHADQSYVNDWGIDSVDGVELRDPRQMGW